MLTSPVLAEGTGSGTRAGKEGAPVLGHTLPASWRVPVRTPPPLICPGLGRKAQARVSREGGPCCLCDVLPHQHEGTQAFPDPSTTCGQESWTQREWGAPRPTASHSDRGQRRGARGHQRRGPEPPAPGEVGRSPKGSEPCRKEGGVRR